MNLTRYLFLIGLAAISCALLVLSSESIFLGWLGILGIVLLPFLSEKASDTSEPLRVASLLPGALVTILASWLLLHTTGFFGVSDEYGWKLLQNPITAVILFSLCMWTVTRAWLLKRNRDTENAT